MAKIVNYILLIVVAVVVVVKTEALGGTQENLRRFATRRNDINERYPSNNENLNQLVGLFKKDSLKVLCEAGKVNPIWCQYKQLLELNNAFEQEQKMVTKRSAGSMCWPGLSRPCKGLVAARLARAAVSDSEDHANNDEEKREAAMKCRPGMANCRRKGKREFEAKPKTNDCPQGWLFCL